MYSSFAVAKIFRVGDILSNHGSPDLRRFLIGGISALTLGPLRLHAAPRARRVLVGHLDIWFSLSFTRKNRQNVVVLF